jgi:predicted Rossmann fold flavoprotein
MFPITDDSATIVKCLMDAATRAGVKIRAGVSVKSVAQREEGFHLVLKGGEELQAEQVLLATGSSPQGYAIARSLGHTIEPPVPSLFTFTVPDPRLQNLAGVSIQTAHLRLQAGSHKPLEQTGAVLITHWGMSGPAVLKLSAWGARVLSEQQYRATLTVNWLPQYNPETLRQDLLKVKSQLPRRSLSGSCPVPIPRRLWEQLVSHVGIGAEVRWAEVSNKHLNSLIQELTRGEFKIAGKGAFKDEFVTCGGVNLKEVDFKTMESRCCPGLFLAGEVLDIDGVTGGFNFQSAWTTGWLAGQAMADL